MAAMMSSKRNRGTMAMDNPYDDDGFYAHRNFKGRRRTGAPTGKRSWHRTMRAKEAEVVRKEVHENA